MTRSYSRLIGPALVAAFALAQVVGVSADQASPVNVPGIDKPVIVVNLPAAKAEGSDLTGQLLKVATLIGERSKTTTP